LARLFRWAVERAYLERSPMEGIRPPGREISRDRVLTDEELVEIWAAAGQLGYPFGALFQLLTLTAQRRGEVAALILQARREEAQRRGENPEKAEPPPRWTSNWPRSSDRP
jgi:integrase